LSIVFILRLALVVVVLSVVSNVMVGFQEEICSKIVGTQELIKVDSEFGIANSKEVRRVLLEDAFVAYAPEYVAALVRLQLRKEAAFAFCNGCGRGTRINSCTTGKLCYRWWCGCAQ
jgi:ABC-type lipoprotein release transport system permease subunit